ncbi:hypothetical protein [Clostridium sp. CAG:265]|uniref:hypothetical protein n=1 Tax=Clostridium sp. CAG:265 TaxID=1262787 RepID=UPI00033C99C5|nr:hypothetical protein [Clostridium sp. CAG:265]CDB75804.1 unknown [Clostridium sp. CAG:265]
MKRAILLALMFALTNFSMTTQGYSQIDSIRTIAEGEIDAPPSSGGESAGNTPSTGDGSTSEGENDSDTTNPNEPIEPIRPGTSPEPVDKEVELDGAIGPWEPDSDDMPNFDGIENGDLIGTKPSDENLFKISVTVPLNMNFMIVSDDPIRFTGKFVSPYHSITNNGTYPLNVSLNSFTRADESSNSSGTARTNSSSKDTKLYVEEPQAGNNKVEMRLNLNYDRPEQGTYLKTINLHNLSQTTDKTLGEIGSNETARIYYRSDLWETPKSEGITEDVVSNFNLILSFSTQNTNAGTENGTGGSAGTGSEGNASSTPSSGNITSGGSNEGADSGSGSTGSDTNIEPSGN